HWVYDRSPLYRWTWIRELFPRVPRRWANLHVGLDESTRQLRGNFPGTRSVVLDLYDPADMTERSIRRARLWTPSRVPAARAAATSLPLADGTLDAAFLLFAAHELRSPAHRLDLFRELRRVLAPGGRLLLVEHRRDLANFLAFGPGVLHFLPSREWRRLAREGGFSSVREFRMTPFVAVTLLEEAA
ncbi:MAG TPA: methyltransferase domain-containing protein, partial [Thermoanaerobaculia bacterium]